MLLDPSAFAMLDPGARQQQGLCVGTAFSCPMRILLLLWSSTPWDLTSYAHETISLGYAKAAARSCARTAFLSESVLMSGLWFHITASVTA